MGPLQGNGDNLPIPPDLPPPCRAERVGPQPGVWTEGSRPPSGGCVGWEKGHPSPPPHACPSPTLGRSFSGLGILPRRMHVLMPAEGSGLLVQVAQVCPWGGGVPAAVGWVSGPRPRRMAPAGAPAAELSRGSPPSSAQPSSSPGRRGGRAPPAQLAALLSQGGKGSVRVTPAALRPQTSCLNAVNICFLLPSRWAFQAAAAPPTPDSKTPLASTSGPALPRPVGSPAFQ